MFNPLQDIRRLDGTRSGLIMAATRQRCQGFTLIELLVVVALVAIFAALALPSFNDTIRRYRVSSAATEITNALQLARAQAIATRQQVNVAQTANPGGCSSGSTTDWHCGIDVYVVDPNAPDPLVRTPTEATIKRITASDFNAVGVQINPGVVSYNPLGFNTLAGGFAPAYVWLLTDGADPAAAASAPHGYVNTVCIGVGGKVKVFASYVTTCT